MRQSDLRNGVIHVTTEKTGAELDIPLHPDLLRSIKACAAQGLTLIGSPHGRPMSAKALSAM